MDCRRKCPQHLQTTDCATVPQFLCAWIATGRRDVGWPAKGITASPALEIGSEGMGQAVALDKWEPHLAGCCCQASSKSRKEQAYHPNICDLRT